MGLEVLKTEAFWSSEVRYKKSPLELNLEIVKEELRKNSLPVSQKGSGPIHKQIICMASWEILINMPQIKKRYFNIEPFTEGIHNHKTRTAPQNSQT